MQLKNQEVDMEDDTKAVVEEPSLRDTIEEAVGADETPPTPQELIDAKEDEPKEPAKTEEPIESKAEEPAKTEEPVEVKAPISWTAKAKEEWAKLPTDIKTEIVKRERDFNIGLQKNAEAAKFARSVHDMLQPYAHVIANEGGTQVEALQNLVQTVGVLRLGTTSEKATIVSRIIEKYGVDVKALDSILAGDTSDQPNNQIEAAINQRLGPIEDALRQQRAANAQRVDQTVEKEMADFIADGKHEFFEDVRVSMADIVEVRAKAGNPISLEDAYNTAVALRPDLMEIVDGRQKKEALATSAKRIAEKANAAVSLPGSDVAPGSNPIEDTDLRGTLTSAWAAAEKGGAGRI